MYHQCAYNAPPQRRYLHRYPFSLCSILLFIKFRAKVWPQTDKTRHSKCRDNKKYSTPLPMVFLNSRRHYGEFIFYQAAF